MVRLDLGVWLGLVNECGLNALDIGWQFLVNLVHCHARLDCFITDDLVGVEVKGDASDEVTPHWTF